MRKIKLILYTNLAVSLILLTIISVWKTVIQGHHPGFIVIFIVLLLIVNAAFCLFSIACIGRGHVQLIAKMWLFAFSLICFYLVFDVLGRIIFIQPTPFRNSPDEHVHHKMLPRTSYRMHDGYGDFDVEMTTNSRGFRGSDITDKSPDKYRIVMLGDSFTMGEGVENVNTFPYLIEKNLNRSGSGKYEVVNMGVESYAPVLEYLLLKRNIDFLKPDLVILNFDMGDILDEYAYRGAATYDGTGDITAVDGFPEFRRRSVSLHERIFDWIHTHLFITDSILEFLSIHFGHDNTDLIENIDIRTVVETKNSKLLLHTLKAPQLENTGEMYSMVEDSIQRVKDLCDRFGCKFILGVYPLGHQVNDTEWVPGKYMYVPKGAEISDRTVEELERFCKNNGLAFFNAFPYFREYKGNELLYYKHNGHWTPAGQRLMADSLTKYLEEYLNQGR